MNRRTLLGVAVASAAVGAGTIVAARRAATGGAQRLRSTEAAEALAELEEPEGCVHHELLTDDGASIHLVERGSGRPIVLVHGVALAAAVWNHQLRDLAGEHRVIALDHRGHGRSTSGEDRHGIDRLARDLGCVLERLDLRDVIVVGHSMGGMTVLRLLADRPELIGERIAGIALVSTSAGPLNPVAAWQGAVAALTPHVARSLRVGLRRAPGVVLPANALGHRLARVGFGPGASAAHVELTRAMNAAGLATLADLLDGLVELDLRQHLPEMRVPALVIVGTHDRLTPPQHAERLAAELPLAEPLVRLDRCGHMPMLERRRELAELLADFVARVPAATPAGPAARGQR